MNFERMLFEQTTYPGEIQWQSEDLVLFVAKNYLTKVQGKLLYVNTLGQRETEN